MSVKNRDNIHDEATFIKSYGNRDWKWYKKLLADVIRKGSPGHVLDVGAGLGYFVEACNKWGIRCTGLEGSQYAVDQANERNPSLDMRQCFFDSEFPLEDNTIDTVFCYQVIEHLHKETVKNMLSECFRVLKKNGVLIIYSPCLYNREQQNKPRHINLYTPSRLRKEIELAGFKNITSFDRPRYILGYSILGVKIMNLIFILYKTDRLSASANCIGYKLEME